MEIERFFLKRDEKPLDAFPMNGGFAGIFRRIAVVGDSLSSGEFESGDGSDCRFHDYYEYSWGQFLAREIGSTVYNFSKGGMTAKEYCLQFASQKNFWDRELACQAYILALGCNDLHWHDGVIPLGTTADICLEDWHNNTESFAGYYGQIIQRYREISPNAFFFLMTMPRDDGDEDKRRIDDGHAALLQDLSRLFEQTYVLDLRSYAPVYDAAFKEKFFLRGHMNPAGYLLTARMVSSYLDYLVRSDFQTFSQVGFINTPYYEKNRLK